jgi:hypothetical protein
MLSIHEDCSSTPAPNKQTAKQTKTPNKTKQSKQSNQRKKEVMEIKLKPNINGIVEGS